MFKLFKKLTRKDLFLVCLSLVFIVTQVWLDLELPGYMSQITVLIQTEGSTMNEILSAGFKMVACALGSLAASMVVAIFAARIASNFGAKLRESVFDKVQSFSSEEINKFSTASLIIRSTNDITQIQTLLVMGLQVLIKAPILATWAIIKIAGKSSQWTMATGVAIICLIGIVGICIGLAFPRIKKMQTLTDKLNRITRENLTGLSVVRAYNAEKYHEAKFAEANNELTGVNLYINKVMSFFMPSIQMLMNGLSLSIYWIGAALIQNANMSDKIGLFSDMIVFSSYAMQIVMAFMMLIMIFIMSPRAMVSAKRISEVLDTVPTIKDGELSEPNTGITGEVEFKNVSFKYPDSEKNILENISFKASKGETVALIGSTGCGKSTLVNLIPRFYDVTEGEILVNGINVKEYKQYNLNNLLGYVSQKAVLFGGNIKDNITYGDNGKGSSGHKDLVKAAITAEAAHFIEGTEDEYDGFAPRNVLYLKLSDDHNIEEPDAEKFINILKSKGVIFEPTPDKFKTT